MSMCGCGVLHVERQGVQGQASMLPPAVQEATERCSALQRTAEERQQQQQEEEGAGAADLAAKLQATEAQVEDLRGKVGLHQRRLEQSLMQHLALGWCFGIWTGVHRFPSLSAYGSVFPAPMPSVCSQLQAAFYA